MPKFLAGRLALGNLPKWGGSPYGGRGDPTESPFFQPEWILVRQVPPPLTFSELPINSYSFLSTTHVAFGECILPCILSIPTCSVTGPIGCGRKDGRGGPRWVSFEGVVQRPPHREVSMLHSVSMLEHWWAIERWPGLARDIPSMSHRDKSHQHGASSSERWWCGCGWWLLLLLL